MSAEEDLAEAFEFHYSGRFDEAVSRYRSIAARYPGSEQAAVATQQLANLKGSGSSHASSTQDRDPEAHFVFSCVRCTIGIRIPATPIADSFKCGRCSHNYHVRWLGQTPDVVMLMPDALPSTVRDPDRPPAFPPKVLDAFKCLDLTPTYDLPAARSAYRALIRQYHPDRVADLGPDLKRVAEQKTKQIVAAFRDIETFLDR